MTRNRTALRSGLGFGCTSPKLTASRIAEPVPPMRVTTNGVKTFASSACYAPCPMSATAGTPAFPALRERPAPPDLSSIDPRLDLESEIVRLKRQKNAVLLAHYYQEEAIQDLADFVGDSLDLSRRAQATDARIIA